MKNIHHPTSISNPLLRERAYGRVQLRNLRRVRRRADITQRKLANMANVSPHIIEQSELGTLSARWADAKKLADALGVSIDDLATV